jgi:hypothetical protein
MRVERLRGASLTDDFHEQMVGFYVLSVILLQQIRGVDIISWLPCVITLGVSSPFDQIL